MRDSILYKAATKANKNPVNVDHLLLVVPESMKSEILRVNNGEPMSGHFDYKKTLSRIRDRYYWPTLSHDVLNYCASCLDCQTLKSGSNWKAPLKPFVPKKPFQLVGTDFMGPFKVSNLGNKYIMICTDLFTK